MSYIVTYDPTLNPDGYAVPGVPLDSLDADALAQIPRHILPSIPAAGFYTIADAPAWDAILSPAPPPEPPAPPAEAAPTSEETNADG